MKKKLKNTFLITFFVALFAIICIFYLNFKKNKEIEKIQDIASKRQIEDFAIRKAFATNFAECASKVLSQKAMENFIIHETMPLGIAWASANKNDGKSEKSIYAYAALRFRDYAEKNDFFAESARKHKQLMIFSSTNKYPDMRWPESSVYAASSSYNYRNQKLTEINIGLNSLDWAPFSSLSKKCHSEHSDLDILLSSSSSIEIKETNSEKPSYSAPSKEEEEKYYLTKRLFWSEFSSTESFKKIQEKIQFENDLIINTIIKNQQQHQKELERSIKTTDEWIYK